MEAEKKKNSFKACLIVLCLLVAYLGCYGLFRWRKLLVRIEYQEVLKVSKTKHQIIRGYDMRSNFIGKTKNLISRASYYFFYPALKSEELLRNTNSRYENLQ